HGVEHAARGAALHAPVAGGEVVLVLAGEGVEAEGATDRGGVAASLVAGPVEDCEAGSVVVGRPGPAGVPPVGHLGDESEKPVALPPDEDRRPRRLEG